MSFSPHTLVLGANGGIGSAVCRHLVREGQRVTLAGRNEAALRSLAADLKMPCEVVDARFVEAVEACAQRVASRLPVTGLVNCVGSLLLKPAHLTTPEEWHAAIETNLTSAFATVRAAYQVLRQNGGAVVLMASSAARVGLSNHEALAAAKGGVIGLMQSAAAGYARHQIRVDAVAPGLIRTHLTEHLWHHEAAAKASEAMHPLGRLGEADDVASLIVWLLNPVNNWITGQTIGVDGGLAALRGIPASSR